VVDTVATGQEATSLKYQAQQVADQHLIGGGTIKVLRVAVVDVTPNPPITGKSGDGQCEVLRRCVRYHRDHRRWQIGRRPEASPPHAGNVHSDKSERVRRFRVTRDQD